MERTLFVEPETVITALFRLKDCWYIDLDEIDRLMEYLEILARSMKEFTNYQTVVFDVNYNSIVRFMMLRPDLFELVGDRIYLIGEKDSLPDLDMKHEHLGKIMNQFIQLDSKNKE